MSAPAILRGGPQSAQLSEGTPSAAAYRLGPEDVLSISVVDLEEIERGSYRIDALGEVDLPLAGRVEIGALTLQEAEKRVSDRFSTILIKPRVTIAVKEFRPHPVSVLGAVRNPGVVQITGQKSLFEVLSLAGGLSPDAGNRINITRPVRSGTLPLPGVVEAANGHFYVAEVTAQSLMSAKNPELNVPIMDGDVISVPRADVIYVIGAVRTAGELPIHERQRVSVLEALAVAGGLDRTASPGNARIYRASEDQLRTEIHIDVRRILAGRSKDVALSPNDILFIPTSATKAASIRAVEAMIQIGTGAAIFR